MMYVYLIVRKYEIELLLSAINERTQMFSKDISLESQFVSPV